MKALYEKSNWGWSEKNKRSEMMEEAAWYLLAKNEEGKICGFSHFRYDMDCDDEVLYVYEVRTYYSLWLRLNYHTQKIGGHIKRQCFLAGSSKTAPRDFDFSDVIIHF